MYETVQNPRQTHKSFATMQRLKVQLNEIYQDNIVILLYIVETKIRKNLELYMCICIITGT